jgi:hypothetical protein
MTTEVPVNEFHLEQLFSLDKGDIIELPGLMVGLDPEESVVAMVSEVTPKTVTLRLTWHGVWLSTRTIRSSKTGPVWEK